MSYPKCTCGAVAVNSCIHQDYCDLKKTIHEWNVIDISESEASEIISKELRNSFQTFVGQQNTPVARDNIKDYLIRLLTTAHDRALSRLNLNHAPREVLDEIMEDMKRGGNA